MLLLLSIFVYSKSYGDFLVRREHPEIHPESAPDNYSLEVIATLYMSYVSAKFLT
jgi:hypothetical protein